MRLSGCSSVTYQATHRIHYKHNEGWSPRGGEESFKKRRERAECMLHTGRHHGWWTTCCIDDKTKPRAARWVEQC